MKKNNPSKRVIYLVFSIVSLFVGLACYLIFNHEADISDLMLNIFHFPKINVEKNIITEIIRGYGADFLWMFSFTFFIQAILELRTKWWLFLCILLGIVYEITQAIGIAKGTADWLDVIAYSFGCVFAILIIFILGGNEG